MHVSRTQIKKKGAKYQEFKYGEIQHAKVVGSTCSNSTAESFSNFNFDTLIVDESTQAKDVEVLVPLMHGIRRLVLIGDQKQLGPIVFSKAAENAGFGASLFERFINAGILTI